MIKLRLTGLPGDLDRLVDWLNRQPTITVLETSTQYANRNSAYYRQYVEIELSDPARPMPYAKIKEER